jgi:hypothetical protein
MIKHSSGTDKRKYLFNLPFSQIPGPFPVNVNVCFFITKKKKKVSKNGLWLNNHGERI